MNEAHLHLLVNHFPIIGTIFGLGILIAGLILKNNSLKNTAFVLFIVATIFTLASMNTGEGAEELVEDMPNIGHKIIHEHEEIAEKFAILMYVLGALSIAGLYLNLKNHTKVKLVTMITLVVAIAATILSKSVGTTGGEIRHSEIRENVTTVNQNSDNSDDD